MNISQVISKLIHSYDEKEDEKRVSISDLRARESTREGRMARRQHQLELLEAAESAEGVLYGPGIDNSMLVKEKIFIPCKVHSKL